MNLGQQRLRAAGAEDTYCALAVAGASYTVAATDCDRSAFVIAVLLFGVVLKLR